MTDGPQISVTIKYKDDDGKGFDMPWAVFHGSLDDVREQVVGYFALTDEEHVNLPLHAVVLNAQRYAHGLQAVSKALPGKVVAVDNPWGDEVGILDLWSAKPQEPTQQELNVKLIDELLHARDELTLKALWARNKEAFSDPAVKAAYSKRGNELKKGD